MTHETNDKSAAQFNNNSDEGSIRTPDFASAYELCGTDYDWMFRGDSTREWIKTDCSVEAVR